MNGHPDTAGNPAICIQKAQPSDAEEILALQKAAYLSEAEACGDYNIPPLLQTSASIAADFRSQLFLKAVAGDLIVGSVRALEQAGTCHIGRLIVHQAYRGQGLGKRLMAAIEREFPRASRFELFTGHRSLQNLALYEKLGYRAFREEKVSEALTFVFLEKIA